MEPAEHRRRNDRAADIALDSERRRTRRALANRPVWPPAVEIADILSQYTSQMALAEDEHKIQALASG